MVTSWPRFRSPPGAFTARLPLMSAISLMCPPRVVLDSDMLEVVFGHPTHAGGSWEVVARWARAQRREESCSQVARAGHDDGDDTPSQDPGFGILHLLAEGGRHGRARLRARAS